MIGKVWRAAGSPPWVARLVFVVGAVSVASALSPELVERIRLINSLVPPVFPAAATTGTAAIGLILILLSRGLRRAKHRAWLLALALTLAAAALHLLKGLDVEESAMCLALGALLVSARGNFTARPDPRSLRAVLGLLVMGPAFAGLVGWIWLTIDARGEQPGTTALDRLAEALLGLVGIPGPVRFSSERSATIAGTALAVLGAAVLLVAVVAALRPARGPLPTSEEDAARLRELLARWGGEDSLGYFALRDDRAAIFGPGGGAAVTYRVVNGVSLAGGDPIGNPDSWDGAIAAWLAEARGYGWVPAALGASEAGARAYHRAGLDVLELGDEAILHTGSFTLEGREMRGVRQAVSRCERAGITTEVLRVGDLSPETVADLRRRADAWRDGPVERGYSMALGRFGAHEDADARIVLARTGEEMVGLLHFVPWGRDGLSLDLMRRDRDAPNGVIETMVTALMTAAPALGINRVSLNFAVFRGVLARGEKLGAGPSTRLWRALLLGASRFWQIDSLYKANAKYRPDWVPRYVAYPGPRDVAAVATAALQAEAFLLWPTREKRGERELAGL